MSDAGCDPAEAHDQVVHVRKPRMTTNGIYGTCDSKFAAVRDAFAANFAAGEEIGAACRDPGSERRSAKREG